MPWDTRLAELLPLLGHRNWIVVADSAFPYQIADGIEVLETFGDHIPILQQVKELMAESPHIDPHPLLDEELNFVTDEAIVGASDMRKAIRSMLAGMEIREALHKDVLSRIDSAGKTYKVVILKTSCTIPYSSVFFELGCGYWTNELEHNLREQMR